MRIPPGRNSGFTQLYMEIFQFVFCESSPFIFRALPGRSKPIFRHVEKRILLFEVKERYDSHINIVPHTMAPTFYYVTGNHAIELVCVGSLYIPYVSHDVPLHHIESRFNRIYNYDCTKTNWMYLLIFITYNQS